MKLVISNQNVKKRSFSTQKKKIQDVNILHKILNKTGKSLVLFFTDFRSHLCKKLSINSFSLRFKLPAFSSIVSHIRSASLYVKIGAGVLVSALTIGLYLGLQTRPLSDEIALPEDPAIRMLLSFEERSLFSGQGAGNDFSLDTPIFQASLNTVSYQVQSGDTLSAIAKAFGVSVRTLIAFNRISSARGLQPGEELQIPNMDGMPYKVEEGDTLDSVSEQFELKVEDLLDANHLLTERLSPGQMLFVPGAMLNDFEYKKALGELFLFPAIGRLTSYFGPRIDPISGLRRFHSAIDIANAVHTPVKAAMAGTVSETGYQPNGLGNYVVVRHQNGFKTLYAHMNAVHVSKGQRVYQGQMLGGMGNTGYSTGSHVHFSIIKDNIPVNPLLYLARQ